MTNKNMPNKQFIADLIGSDLNGLMRACNARNNLGRFSEKEELAFFKTHIGDHVRLIEMLGCPDKDVQFLALRYLGMFYTHDEHVARLIIEVIKRMEDGENYYACPMGLNEKNQTSTVLEEGLNCLASFSSGIAGKFLTDICLKGGYETKNFNIQFREKAFSPLLNRIRAKTEKGEFLNDETVEALLKMMVSFPEFNREKAIKDKDDPQGIIRRGLLMALGDFDGEKITRAIANSAKHDPRLDLRRFACELLGSRNEEELVIGTLKDVLAVEQDKSVRRMAVDSLFLRRSEFALDFFRKEIFEAERCHYRLGAILAGLQDIGSEDFVRFLLRELQKKGERGINEEDRSMICRMLPGKLLRLPENEALKEEIIKVLWDISQTDSNKNIQKDAFQAFRKIVGEKNITDILLRR